jgi:hypothetical protein
MGSNSHKLNWLLFKKGSLVGFTTVSLIGFTSGFKVEFTMGRGGYRGGRAGVHSPPPLRFRGKKCSQFDKSYVFFNFKLFDYFLFNGNIMIKGRKKYFSSLLKINITNDVSIRRHCVLFYWC